MLIVDGHVHVHARFDRQAFLNTASARFEALRGADEALCVLLLTETRGAHAFEDWRAGRDPVPGWAFEATAEPVSLVARRNGAVVLAVVAGSQIRARCGLEVLTLGTTAEVQDGMPFEETVDAALASAPLVVIPWGFGKWTGARGRRVRSALEQHAGTLHLGDNGGRPWFIPEPELFRRAGEVGSRVLPGSDPLPLPGHEGSVLRRGFTVDAPADPGRPMGSLLEALSSGRPVRAFGRPARTFAFAADQVRMQWRRRRPG